MLSMLLLVFLTNLMHFCTYTIKLLMYTFEHGDQFTFPGPVFSDIINFSGSQLFPRPSCRIPKLKKSGMNDFIPVLCKKIYSFHGYARKRSSLRDTVTASTAFMAIFTIKKKFDCKIGKNIEPISI